MLKVIREIGIPINNRLVVPLPEGSEILGLELQNDGVVLFAAVNIDEPRTQDHHLAWIHKEVIYHHDSRFLGSVLVPDSVHGRLYLFEEEVRRMPEDETPEIPGQTAIPMDIGKDVV